MTKNAKNKKLFFFSIFLIPSLLCLGFYYFAIRKPLTSGRTNIFVKLPHYGPASIKQGTTDSIFYQIPAFKFVNQSGKEISTSTLENQIYVIGITNDESSESEQVAAQLYRVQDKLSYLKKDFKIISVINAIEADTLKKLAAFAEKVHANERIWNIVAGPDQELSDWLLNNDLVSKSKVSFAQNMELLLIDRNQQIRGHYPGNNLKEVNRLIDEVVVLAAEYGKIKNMD